MKYSTPRIERSRVKICKYSRKAWVLVSQAFWEYLCAAHNEFHCKCNNTHLHISFYNSAKQDCKLEAENVFLQTLESSFSLLLSIFQCKLIYVYFDSEDGANYYYYCWCLHKLLFFVCWIHVSWNQLGAHKVCGFANYYVQKFAAINGILFPGGATSLKGGPFYQTSEKLFNVQITNPDSFLLC